MKVKKRNGTMVCGNVGCLGLICILRRAEGKV
jgi:hypothetical protein